MPAARHKRGMYSGWEYQAKTCKCGATMQKRKLRQVVRFDCPQCGLTRLAERLSK